MANLKPIKPSLKERKRYAVIEVKADAPVSQDDIIDTINKVCLDFMGILGLGKAGVLILRNQISGDKVVIKVNNRYVDHLKSALMLVTKIGGARARLTVTGVSGILKKAREKFITNS
jgi:RNase P/RNase MRP subunit POP5